MNDYQNVTNEVFTNQYGEHYHILRCFEDQYHNKKADVLFHETNRVKTVGLDVALKCTAKDEFFPSIAGVGYTAGANTGIHKREYDVWTKMIKRCYDPADPSYPTYGALGVTVDERWHNFANYLEDISQMDHYEDFINSTEGRDWNLDKDALQAHLPMGQRVYSKDTCMYIPTENNLRYMNNDHRDKFNNTYNGVRRLKNRERFIARIVIDKKRYSIGIYDNEEIAASVYNYVLSANGYSETYNPGVCDFNYENACKHCTSERDIILPIPTGNVIIPGKCRDNYYGVSTSGKNKDRFHISVTIGGKSIMVGTYIDKHAAAIIRNWYIDFYHSPSTKNIIDEANMMTIGEAIQCRVLDHGRRLKYICSYRDDIEVNHYEFYNPNQQIVQPQAIQQPCYYDYAQLQSQRSIQSYQYCQPAAFNYDYTGYSYLNQHFNQPLVEMCRVVEKPLVDMCRIVDK